MTREEARLGMLVNTIAGAGVIVTLCCDAGASYADPCADTATVRLGPQWWMDFALSSLTANRITHNHAKGGAKEPEQNASVSGSEQTGSPIGTRNDREISPSTRHGSDFRGRTPSARTGAIPSGSAGTLSDGAPL